MRNESDTAHWVFIPLILALIMLLVVIWAILYCILVPLQSMLDTIHELRLNRAIALNNDPAMYHFRRIEAQSNLAISGGRFADRKVQAKWRRFKKEYRRTTRRKPLWKRFFSAFTTR
jgi:hypothetical protein